MLLSIIVWMNLLVGGLVIYRLPLHTINTQLATSLVIGTQQFEAAETALLAKEAQLTRLVGEPSGYDKILIPLAPTQYGDYQITCHAIRLPQAFCMMPHQAKGFYYQLTVTAQPIHSSTATPLVLQSTVAIPTTLACHDSLTKRKEGRSAWCQL